jgi:hypothetical protein
MKTITSLACRSVVAVMLAQSAIVSAAPVDLSRVLDSVGYVAHVDVDKLAATESWRRIEPMLSGQPNLSAGVDLVERVLNIRVPQDVHDITVFGSDYDNASFVVVIRSEAKRERIEAALSLNATYSQRDLPGGRVVHTWLDHKEGDNERLAAFGPAGELVVSGDEALLVQSLDLLEKKPAAKSLAGQLPFESTKDDAVTIYLAGNGISKAIGRRNELGILLKPVQRAWITAHEAGPSMVVSGQLIATDAKSGELLRNVAEGARSFVVLFARTDLADDKAVRGAELLDNFNSSLDGTKISFRWSVPSQMIEDAIQKKLEENGDNR